VAAAAIVTNPTARVLQALPSPSEPMRIHRRPLSRENVHRAGLRRGVAGWARMPISWSCLGAVVAASLAWAPPVGAGGAERSTPSSPSNPPSAAHGHFAGRIEIRGGRRLYLECRGSGRPTVVLESGLGNAADVWGGAFLAANDPASDPRRAVLPAVARFTRVCAYDRPGTSRLDPRTDRFKPSRSDPVAMPRTALDIARDLHALLRNAPRAAGVRGPYVLAGHSVGGLTQRLYATLHPRRIAGLVLIDATPERYAALLGELLANGSLTPEQYAAVTAPLPPPGLENYSDYERLTIDASGAQMRQAQADTPLPRMPLVFLSLPKLELPPDWRSEAVEAMERMYQAAQHALAKLVPGARQVIAPESGHYIQLDQPNLVINAIRRVVRRARRH
jgi:pimeloyl-ACP methyl ester carboxylesterase